MDRIVDRIDEARKGHVEVHDDQLALTVLVLPDERLTRLVQQAVRAIRVAVLPQLTVLALGDVPRVDRVQRGVRHDDAVRLRVVADAVAAREARGILEEQHGLLVGAVALALHRVEPARTERAEVEVALVGDRQAIRARIVPATPGQGIRLGVAEEVGILLVVLLRQERHFLRAVTFN